MTQYCHIASSVRAHQIAGGHWHGLRGELTFRSHGLKVAVWSVAGHHLLHTDPVLVASGWRAVVDVPEAEAWLDGPAKIIGMVPSCSAIPGEEFGTAVHGSGEAGTGGTVARVFGALSRHWLGALLLPHCNCGQHKQ